MTLKLKKISPKNDAFTTEYLVDYDGKKAAIRAGYAPKHAASKASHLLADPIVQRSLKTKQGRVALRAEVTAARVLQELARLAFADPRKLFDEEGRIKNIADMDEDTAATLSSVQVIKSQGYVKNDGTSKNKKTYKFSQWDKNAALEKLAKHLGMFKEDAANMEVNITIEGRDADCG
jgi:phage terminase small subunit